MPLGARPFIIGNEKPIVLLPRCQPSVAAPPALPSRRTIVSQNPTRSTPSPGMYENPRQQSTAHLAGSVVTPRVHLASSGKGHPVPRACGHLRAFVELRRRQAPGRTRRSISLNYHRIRRGNSILAKLVRKVRDKTLRIECFKAQERTRTRPCRAEAG